MNGLITYNARMAKNTAAKGTRFEMRLSEEADEMSRKLALHLGISKASVFEMAVRKLYREEMPNPETIDETIYEHKATPGHVVNER